MSRGPRSGFHSHRYLTLINVPGSDLWLRRGPWQQLDPRAGQNLQAFPLPGCPSTFTKAIVVVTPAAIRSYSSENVLPFNKNNINWVPITEMSVEKNLEKP